MNFLSYVFVIISSLAFYFATVSSIGLNEDFTWSRINFEWPTEAEISSRFAYGSSRGLKYRPRRPPSKSNAETPILFEESPMVNGNTDSENQNSASEIAPGSIDYQYVNNIPMGLNVWKDKVFISIPRRRLGVPSTLNYVSLSSNQRHNVPLKPYPNWNINLYPDTSGKGENLVSVYRFAIDPCDRMWLVDTGILELPGNRTYVRPQHQLIVINLQNDEIIHRYNIPDSVVTPATTLSSVTVDVTKGTCRDAFVYLPDLAGYGVTVYSMRQNRSWRVRHNYFFLESMRGEFFSAGHHFQWNDGVFSIELTDLKKDGYRDVYFHSMAGTHQFKITSRIFRNETLATRTYHAHDFQVVGDRGQQTQTSTAEIHTPTGNMFLGLVNQNALGCWNIHKPLNTLSIVQLDANKMVYPSDVKIVGNKVYVLTTTMPGFLYGRLNYSQINFRIWSNDVASAIKGTSCEN